MNEDVLWVWASQASAEIINLHVGLDVPKAELFQRIQHTVYAAMVIANQEKLHQTVKFSLN